MTVKELQAIVSVETMDLLSNVISQVSAASPAVPWKMTLPAPLLTRKCPAVPVASALVSLVMAFAVATPDDAAAKAVLLNVSVPSKVPLSASLGLVGGAPVRIASVPAPPAFTSTSAVMASHAALRAAVLILKFKAKAFLL